MARRVFLSPAATRDLNAIRAWLSQPGAGIRAQRKVGAILSTIRQLAEWPFLGQAGAVPGTRQRVCEGHVIVYRLFPGDDGDIEVVRVWAPGQDRR